MRLNSLLVHSTKMKNPVAQDTKSITIPNIHTYYPGPYLLTLRKQIYFPRYFLFTTECEGPLLQLMVSEQDREGEETVELLYTVLSQLTL